MKKILSMLLVCMMIFSCMGTTVFADEADDVEDVVEVVETEDEAAEAPAEEEAAAPEEPAEEAPAEEAAEDGEVEAVPEEEEAEPAPAQGNGAARTLIVAVILLAFGAVIIFVLPKMAKKSGKKEAKK